MPPIRSLPVKRGAEAQVSQGAIATVLARKAARDSEEPAPAPETDVVKWAEDNFRIAETGKPIVLLPHQRAILRYIFARDAEGRLRFTTAIYSTPKKSGKTTIAALVLQWVAETWGRFGEILCVGNDAAQAKERAFAKMSESVQMTPGYDARRGELPGAWRLLTSEATCTATGTKVKAVASDYAGEAGGNPTLSVWTELWGFIHKADLRFWAELGPSPTRPDSMRWVETYAGYDGESELLWDLYQKAVKNGRQLTAGELGDLSAFAEAPNPDSLVPCWVDEQAGIFAYWDAGPGSRRMPWQQGAHGEKYYSGEAATQTESQFDRLHWNLWVSAESVFVPIEWWDACLNPLPLAPGDPTPVVLAGDAAVTGDCWGLVAITRDPADPENKVAVRGAQKWDPPAGGAINYTGPEAAIRWYCEHFNVVQFAYDPYQLHDMAGRLTRDGVVWCREFGQGEERLIADKGLYDLIAHRRIRHDGDAALREHISNANAKQAANEDTKLRLVKKSAGRKIDLAVCLSMGASECLRLMLE